MVAFVAWLAHNVIIAWLRAGPVSAVKFWRGERNGPRATEGTTEMPCSVSGMGLAFAAEVAQNFLMEPGAERSVIAKVLNG